jgi:glycosyltransferase involved in cell wall biosynthesis
MAGTTDPSASGAPAGPEALPTVSVVLPAHNEEALVGTALRSVADQSFPPGQIEAIVVNNGSQDRTGEIVASAARELAPLAVRLIHDPRRGIARAKNLGGRAARGRYLVFMDADSWMSSGLVARVVERAGDGERAASIRVVADSSDALDRAFFDLMEWGKRLFGIRANMAWIERALFEELGGFDEALNQAEDLDLLTRARRRGVEVGHVAEERIATSPRRLHRGPLRLGLLLMFGRWALGNFGIGRRWPY